MKPSQVAELVGIHKRVTGLQKAAKRINLEDGIEWSHRKRLHTIEIGHRFHRVPF